MNAEDSAESIRPSSTPIAVAATMNGSEVACRSAGDAVLRRSITLR